MYLYVCVYLYCQVSFRRPLGSFHLIYSSFKRFIRLNSPAYYNKLTMVWLSTSFYTWCVHVFVHVCVWRLEVVV